jgi:hypothetical protein
MHKMFTRSLHGDRRSEVARVHPFDDARISEDDGLPVRGGSDERADLRSPAIAEPQAIAGLVARGCRRDETVSLGTSLSIDAIGTLAECRWWRALCDRKTIVISCWQAGGRALRVVIGGWITSHAMDEKWR